MTKRLVIIGTILILILCITSVSSAVQYPDNLRKYVSDEANLFSSSEITTLNDRCAEIEKTTGMEIAIVTVSDTGGQDVIQYAAKTGEINGVGSARTNDGVVILFSLTNQPGWAIATGRGAESTLTDAKTSQFLRDADPALDNSQYFAGTEIILTDIQDVYTAKQSETLSGTVTNVNKANNEAYSKSITIMFGIIICVVVIMIAILFRGKRW